MESPICITGATGFVGSHIAREILQRGKRVRAVVRAPERARWLAELGAEIREADLSCAADLRIACEGANTLVSNAALGSGQGDLREFEQTNHRGIDNLFRAAADAGIKRIVHVSTVAVYRTRLRRTMTEDSPGYDPIRRRFNVSDLTTDWRYARTKTLGERLAWELAEELGVALTIVRPGPVYGSGDPKLTAGWLRSMRRRVVPAATVGVPFVHAGDVAYAIANAVSRPNAAGRAYNLAGPPVSPFRALTELKRQLGYGPMLLPIWMPLWVAYDTSRAAESLGFKNRPIEHGIREIVEALAE